jgi:hypothetical protein
VQAVFDYFGNHGWDVYDLMAVGYGVLPFQFMPARAARIRLDVVTVFDLLWRYQFPSGAWVTGLASGLALVLGALAGLGRNVWPIRGRRLGGVTRIAIDSLSQRS